MNDHHTVLVRGFVLGVRAVKAQGGVGSVVSVVAAELSTVLAVLIVIAIALAMLSFAGRALDTVKGCDAEDSPALAASSVTVTKSGVEEVVPKATKFWEIVAVIVVAVPPGSIVTPEVDPFQRI
jgi:hypothetical protein